MSPTDHERPQTVMGRVLLLLEPFREADSLTLTELAERTGFPRSSTHRMLLQLVEVGWIRRSGTSYHLGPKLTELGSLAQGHDRIHQAARASMYQLHKSTRMAVHLAVLEGDDLLYLEKVGGRWASSALPTHVGQRRPAPEAVEGLALLAYRDGREPALEELVFDGLGGEQVHCLAVAFDAQNGEIAALSLTGPVGRTPEGAARALALAAELVASALSA